MMYLVRGRKPVPVVMLLFFLAVLVRIEVAQAAPAPWRLAPSFGCLESCARFFPRDGSPSLEQGWFRSLPLPVDGELVLPPGSFELRQSIGGHERRLELLGPAVLEVTGEQVRTRGPVRGRYLGRDRQGGPPPPPPLSLPPLVAGVHGTRFDFLVTLQGTVLLTVTEGKVEVGWQAGIPGEPVRLEADQAALADRQAFQTRELRRLEGDEARQARGMLLAADEAVRHRGGTTPEGAFAEFSSLLAAGAPDVAARAALELAETWRNEPVAPHALYLAWLRAEGRGLSETARQLETTLRERYPGSAWISFLEAKPAASPSSGAPSGVPAP